MIVLAGLAAYSSSFSGVFLLDDEISIRSDTRIRQFWPIGRLLADQRPMVTLSLALNYALGGFEVRGYHAVNLTIHLLAALTFFALVDRTLQLPGFARYHAAGPWIAGAVALLWAVHPLCTQAVTYLIQRSESMMALFYLLMLYCLVRGAAGARATPWYVAAVLACALGMGSKAVMVTAPVVALLYDRTFITGSIAEAVRRRWPLYLGLCATWLVLVAGGVVRGVLFPQPGQQANVGFGYRGTAPLEYLLTQPGVILHYLRLAAWPHPLCLDCGWPVAHSGAAVAVPGLVIVALLAATVWAMVRAPAVGFLGAAFFLILAPTSSFIPIRDLAFEHRMYLPLAAVVCLAVVGAYAAAMRLFGRAQRLPAGIRLATGLLVVGLASTMGAATYERNETYRDPVVMWESVLAVNPNHARAHVHLANYLHVAGGNEEKAESLWRKALELDPNNLDALANLGVVTLEGGDVDQAIDCFQRALKVDPGAARAHYNLGNALRKKGRNAEAVEAYRQAQRLTPGMLDAYVMCGNALADQKRYAEAIAELQAALKAAPPGTDRADIVRVHYNLANTLARAGKNEEAAEEYLTVVALDPNHYRAYYGLGLALKAQDRVQDAIEAFQAALTIKPDYTEASQALEIVIREPTGP